MKKRPFLTSLTRISDFAGRPFEIRALPREQWARGDYVAGEVVERLNNPYRVELQNGRMADVVEGDVVVGAFGERFATLEATGSWASIGPDGHMHLLTGAGLFGKGLSKAIFLKPLVRLRYRGHVFVEGEKRRMKDYVERLPEVPFRTPSILLIGSSMSAGKTTAARIIIRMLKHMGLRVVGAKLTGAGRFRDVLSMYDAGADAVFDFVDVGQPSTIGPSETLRRDLRQLLTRMARAAADVAVIEAGASPLEPYNGDVAIDELGESVRLTVLCTSDPYAVVGIVSAFGHTPDFVTGIATNTAAGVALIEKLSGIRALNVLEHEALPALKAILRERLGLPDEA
jgi:hypothetical protein